MHALPREERQKEIESLLKEAMTKNLEKETDIKTEEAQRTKEIDYKRRLTSRDIIHSSKDKRKK